MVKIKLFREVIMQFFNQKTFILLVPVLLAVLFYTVRSIFNNLKRKRAEELFKNYHKDRIIYFSREVNFFGQKSEDGLNIRGSGSLLLTPDQLHFKKWLPDQDLIIPLEDIINVERVDSFMGKSKNKTLLKIDFNNENGEIDSAAWLLDNMHNWENVLKDYITQ
jgi:hypothetical protein